MIAKTKKVIITGSYRLKLKNGEEVTKVLIREPNGHRTSFLDSNLEHEYHRGKANLILSLKQSDDYTWHLSVTKAIYGNKPETSSEEKEVKPVTEDSSETAEK